jgi:hypothetical protein
MKVATRGKKSRVESRILQGRRRSSALAWPRVLPRLDQRRGYRGAGPGAWVVGPESGEENEKRESEVRRKESTERGRRLSRGENRKRTEKRSEEEKDREVLMERFTLPHGFEICFFIYFIFFISVDHHSQLSLCKAFQVNYIIIKSSLLKSEIIQFHYIQYFLNFSSLRNILIVFT